MYVFSYEVREIDLADLVTVLISIQISVNIQCCAVMLGLLRRQRSHEVISSDFQTLYPIRCCVIQRQPDNLYAVSSCQRLRWK